MGAAPIASAAEPTASELLAARELFSKAEKDEDMGRWGAALEKIRRAAAVKATPGLRFHVALCEEKLGQLVAALNDYAASESLARAEGNKEVLEAVSEPLAALKARVPTLALKVRPDIPGTVVRVDGTAVSPALLGTTMRLDVGQHAVGATAPSRQPFEVTVVLVEGDAKAVDVELAPAAPPPSAPPATSVVTTPPSPAAQDVAHPPSHAAALVFTAGAVALVGAGVASFVVAGNKQSSAEAQCRQLVSCDGLRAPVRAFDWLALGAWVGGAAVGTVAVILWAAPGGADRATAGLVIGPGSLGLRGSF
jgi:hypothetical protein